MKPTEFVVCRQSENADLSAAHRALNSKNVGLSKHEII